MFRLHPKLKEDLRPIGRMSGSYLFLLPDSDNAWAVLVPEVADILELHQLSSEQQTLLLADINTVSRFMEQQFKPDKLNIGSLGNMVAQLHIHIICRHVGDKAWPQAIWGSAPGLDEKVIAARIEAFKSLLK